MNIEIIVLGDNGFGKCKLHCYNNPNFLKVVIIDNIIISG